MKRLRDVRLDIRFEILSWLADRWPLPSNSCLCQLIKDYAVNIGDTASALSTQLDTSFSPPLLPEATANVSRRMPR